MHEELELLVRLQHKDEDIRILEGKAQSIPQQIERIEQEIEGRKQEIELLRTQQEEAAKARRQSENEAEDLSNKIQKLELQVFQVKTNKEYQAILQEVTESKEAKSTKENDVIRLMEEEEKVGEEIKRATAEFEQSSATAQQQINEFKIVWDETNVSLDAARKERIELLSGLGRDIRQRYEKIHASLDGRAVVPVIKSACGGCFTALPPQTVNEVRKKTRFITCEVCSRILVWDDAHGQ
jgi:predicted  nucleic acid-binding Zn-ribbon protein